MPTGYNTAHQRRILTAKEAYSRDSEALNWARANGCIVTKKDPQRHARFDCKASVHSHFLLDGAAGGIISIPSSNPDALREWYMYLASDLQRKIALCVSEQRTPVFRFHSDIDCLLPLDWCGGEAALSASAGDMGAPQGLTLNDLQELSQLWQDATAQCFRVERRVIQPYMTVIIAARAAEVKRVEPEGQSGAPPVPMVKHGVHLYMPNMHVDSSQALWITSWFTSLLQSHRRFSKLFHPGSMAKIDVDNAVFTYNGLRMLYMDKTVECPECQSLRNGKQAGVTKHVTDMPGQYESCRTSLCTNPRCFGSALYQGRVYTVELVLSGDGLPNKDQTDLLRSNVFEALRWTSIRIHSRETPARTLVDKFSPPEMCPPPLEVDTIPVKGPSDKSMPRIKVEDMRNLYRVIHCKKPRNQAVVPLDSREVQAMLQAVRNYTVTVREADGTVTSSNMYKLVIAAQAFVDAARSKYQLYVSGPGCAWCENRQGNHSCKKGRVYFVFTRKGVHQCCGCWSSTVRDFSHLKCSDFNHSKQYGMRELPNSVRDVLFPKRGAMTTAGGSSLLASLAHDDPSLLQSVTEDMHQPTANQLRARKRLRQTKEEAAVFEAAMGSSKLTASRQLEEQAMLLFGPSSAAASTAADAGVLRRREWKRVKVASPAPSPSASAAPTITAHSVAEKSPHELLSMLLQD